MDKDSEMEIGEGAEEIVEEMDDDDNDEDDSDSSGSDAESADEPDVYLPGKPLAEGEELVCDETAYVMLHQARTGAPCLSFDILPDELGANRESFPMTSYIVAGTQAAQAHVNNVIVMKMSNLVATQRDEDDESDSDEEENTTKKQSRPFMDCALIKHAGCVNRIRCTKIGNKTVASTWSELGRVNVWDLSEPLLAVDDKQLLMSYDKEGKGNKAKALYTFSGHQREGFGLDWSPVKQGLMATGDCRRDIHVWQPHEAGTWAIDQRPLIGHTDSVEDLQWSPNEQNVLASCSVDKSLRIWDTRAAPNKACMIAVDDAHTSDINVISWNRNEPLIASGGDDGTLHIWDLRQIQTQQPVATFKHHSKYITTVEWHPTDSSVLATGGADDQIVIWDMAVETDPEAAGTNDNDTELNNLPPQLLFIHQGQSDIKELHWHPQLPGVILSTAHSGFNIFKTISV